MSKEGFPTVGRHVIQWRSTPGRSGYQRCSLSTLKNRGLQQSNWDIFFSKLQSGQLKKGANKLYRPWVKSKEKHRIAGSATETWKRAWEFPLQGHHRTWAGHGKAQLSEPVCTLPQKVAFYRFVQGQCNPLLKKKIRKHKRKCMSKVFTHLAEGGAASQLGRRLPPHCYMREREEAGGERRRGKRVSTLCLLSFPMLKKGRV